MARSFNGSTDYVNTRLTTQGFGVTATTQAFTFSCWALLLSGAGSLPMLFCPASGAGLLLFGINVGNFSGLNLYYLHVETKSTTSPTVGRWFHAAATYNGSSSSPVVAVYLNGVLDPNGQQGAFSGHVNSGFDFQIANGANSSNSFWKGSIADMAAWNVALTAGEIAGLASGQRPYQIRPQNRVGDWPLFGDVSPEPDLSGNANNGTLTGTALAPGPPTTLSTPRWPQFLAAAAPSGGVLPHFLPFHATVGQLKSF